MALFREAVLDCRGSINFPNLEQPLSKVGRDHQRQNYISPDPENFYLEDLLSITPDQREIYR